MLPEMKYPGDTDLSEEIRERILKTFEQALDLADSGSHREALLGCDFVLRLDPLFEPARVLHRRLSEGGTDIGTADLREHTRGGAAADETKEGALPGPEPHEESGPVAPPPLAEAPLGATPPEQDLQTVFHPVEDGDNAPQELGEVELDASSAAPERTAYDASAYETGSFESPPEHGEPPVDSGQRLRTAEPVEESSAEELSAEELSVGKTPPASRSCRSKSNRSPCPRRCSTTSGSERFHRRTRAS